GLLLNRSTSGLETLSHSSVCFCLLPFRVRVRVPARDLGSRYLAAWTESYLHRLDPRLSNELASKITRTLESQVWFSLSALTLAGACGSCPDLVIKVGQYLFNLETDLRKWMLLVLSLMRRDSLTVSLKGSIASMIVRETFSCAGWIGISVAICSYDLL